MDLSEIAEHVMIERGFIPGFSSAIQSQLDHIQGAASPSASMCDRREWLWVSIDNEDSRDLDQLTYVESDKICVAVADVDALVKMGSAIDNRAGHNTTSIYTPTKVFPMLPLALSTDLTSLNENVDRCALVIESRIGKGGEFELHDLYLGIVRNKAKLAYNSVAAFLEGKAPCPSDIKGVAEQLRKQDQFAQSILEQRNAQGALHLVTFELQAIVEKGMAVGIKEREKNRAHQLIENFMIATNVAVTHFLNEHHLPLIKRVVRTPKRWDRIVSLARAHHAHLPAEPDAKTLRAFLIQQQKADPERFPDLSLAIIKLIGKGEYILSRPDRSSPGHFDLALADYTHATAPNRRFVDLVTQRLLKSQLMNKKSPYTLEDLSAIAHHSTQKEDDATKVERHLQKSAAAMVLKSRVGQRFRAMVTGAGPKGTWVRLYDPPIEGKLIKGFHGIDVGDYLFVKLVHVDIVKGYIDFEKA